LSDTDDEKLQGFYNLQLVKWRFPKQRQLSEQVKECKALWIILFIRTS